MSAFNLDKNVSILPFLTKQTSRSIWTRTSELAALAPNQLFDYDLVTCTGPEDLSLIKDVIQFS